MSHKHTSSEHLPIALIASLVVVWFVLFILGTYGHLGLKNTVDDSCFKAFQLFHLHYNPHPGAEAAKSGEGAVGWPVQIARFGCALWDILILPAVFWLFFDRRLRLWWVGLFWRRHVVVCGSCSRTRALVADLRSHGARVVWIGRYPDERDSVPKGAVLIAGDSGDAAVLASAAVHRADRLVALHEEDRLNIETLVAAGKLCSKRPAGMAPLEAYAHIADTRFQHSLQELIRDNACFAGPQVRVHLFNYYELIARLLARRFPIPPTLVDACPPPEHLIIVGFAAFGQCVARRLILMIQKLYRQQGVSGTEWSIAKPRITVVDPQAEARIAEFGRLNPAFSQYCDVEPCALSTTDSAFPEQIGFARCETEERRTLVFCIETESETLRMLGLLADLSAGVASQRCSLDRVFCRISRPERLGTVLDQLKPKSGALEFVYFASDAEVFNADVILNQSLDLLALKIHQAYLGVAASDSRANNLPPAVDKTWAELSEDDRESNREAADHLWAKLRALGFALSEVPVGDTLPPPSEDLLKALRAREEELAHAEHDRWMTWRVLKGWRWGAVRDNAKKLHPDLCDYDQLAEGTKEKDRANIRVIPELLKQGRLLVNHLT